MDKNQAKEIAQTIIRLLKQQNQLQLLSEVIEELSQAQEAQTQLITIESASELMPDSQEQLKQILQVKLGYEPSIEFVVNPELVAGIRVQINDQLIDASLKSQLENIFEKIH